LRAAARKQARLGQPAQAPGSRLNQLPQLHQLGRRSLARSRPTSGAHAHSSWRAASSASSRQREPGRAAALRPEREPSPFCGTCGITIPKVCVLARRVRQPAPNRPVLRRSMHRWRQPQVLHALRAAAHRGGPPDPRKPGVRPLPTLGMPAQKPPPPAGPILARRVLPKKAEERLLTRPARAIALAFTVCSLAAERASTRLADGDWRCYGNDPGGIRFAVWPRSIAATSRGSSAPGPTTPARRRPESGGLRVHAACRRWASLPSTPGTRSSRWTARAGASSGSFDARSGSRGAASRRTAASLTGRGRREQAHPLRHARRPADRSRRADRKPAWTSGRGTVDLRRGVGRRLARRGGTPSLRRGDLRGPGHHRRRPFRRTRNRAERRRARLRRPDRKEGVAVRDHTAARPTGTRNGGGPGRHRTGVNCWSIMSVDSNAGLVFLPLGSARLRLLRRHRQGKEPLRQLPGRARGPHRKAVWHSSGAPRRLGLRPARSAAPGLAVRDRRAVRPSSRSRRWASCSSWIEDG